MKRAIAFCVILSFTACTTPVTIVTPQGKIAYTANEVLKRVQELQQVAIAVDATPNNGIPKDVFRVIITFTVEAAKVLDATPAGWGTTLAVAWSNAKGKIPLRYLTDPRIQTAILAVDVALAIWFPNGGA